MRTIAKRLVIAATLLVFFLGLYEVASAGNGPIRRILNNIRANRMVATLPIITTTATWTPTQQQQCVNGMCQQTYWEPVYQPTVYIQEARQRPPHGVIVSQAPAKSVGSMVASVNETSFAVELTAAESSDGFRRGVLKGLRQARKAGKVTPRQAMRVRVSMFSPAFRDHVKTLCLVQMASSDDSGQLPTKTDGTIDETAIDWEGFAGFLERVVPLILELLQAFGV